MICRGDEVVVDGLLRTGDLNEIVREVQERVPDLFARRSAWLADNQDGAISPVSGD